MAKYFVRTFFRHLSRLVKLLEQNRWTDSHKKRLIEMATAMSSRSSKSREDLLILFGFDETKSTELQKNWAKEHREYFQAVLSSKLGKMGVLQSKSIKNKQDYLYSMKVYEARLNRANLVGNFN